MLTINGFTPARENFNKMEYVLQVLDPHTGLRLDLPPWPAAPNECPKDLSIATWGVMSAAPATVVLENVIGRREA